jgi:hypothetical protein
MCASKRARLRDRMQTCACVCGCDCGRLQLWTPHVGESVAIVIGCQHYMAPWRPHPTSTRDAEATQACLLKAGYLPHHVFARTDASMQDMMEVCSEASLAVSRLRHAHVTLFFYGYAVVSEVRDMFLIGVDSGYEGASAACRWVCMYVCVGGVALRCMASFALHLVLCVIGRCCGCCCVLSHCVHMRRFGGDAQGRGMVHVKRDTPCIGRLGRRCGCKQRPSIPGTHRCVQGHEGRSRVTHAPLLRIPWSCLALHRLFPKVVQLCVLLSRPVLSPFSCNSIGPPPPVCFPQCQTLSSFEERTLRGRDVPQRPRHQRAPVPMGRWLRRFFAARAGAGPALGLERQWSRAPHGCRLKKCSPWVIMCLCPPVEPVH